MRLQMLVVALALAGLWAPASAQRAPTTAASVAVPREAAAVVDAFHAALSRGDTMAAAALLDPKVLIYESGRAERSKAEYAAHHLPRRRNFREGYSAEREASIRPCGRNLGLGDDRGDLQRKIQGQGHRQRRGRDYGLEADRPDVAHRSHSLVLRQREVSTSPCLTIFPKA